ncbi:GGDEF domain-containing protein [Streptomyces antimycoticus]|uniref:GGDEF domain-containing protein n=1 Tax=Streptomyces antimycoticus TaxID=68175 RepID=UPI00343668A7
MMTHPALAALQILVPVLLAGGWALHAHRLYRRLNRVRRDPITGLYTRDGWSRAARRIIARHDRAVVVLGDLDSLKRANDRHGHAAGDALIAASAERLADWCGTSGVAGRLGGDEFVAVLPDDQDLEQRLGELARLLAQPVVHQGVKLPAGASLGAARLADLDTPTLSDALAAADAAMYQAKGRGRRGRRLLAVGRRLAAPIAERFRLAA